jgi:hypothetical protein
MDALLVFEWHMKIYPKLLWIALRVPPKRRFDFYAKLHFKPISNQPQQQGPSSRPCCCIDTD